MNDFYDDEWAAANYDRDRITGQWIEREPSCPKCGSSTHTSHYAHDECAAGCDTSVERCDECDWEGEPE